MAGPPPGNPPPPPPMGYGPPPMPPPPPGSSWQPPKPTSGKAVAALVCGIGGPILAFACPVFGVAVLVGLVLGILAMLETGKEGTRSGRGLAIAGTVLSTLSLVATIGIAIFFFTMFSMEDQEGEQNRRERLAQDSTLIVSRITQYAKANDGSLGPGGPVLARAATPVSNAGPPQNVPPKPVGGNVMDSLQLEHLVADGELTFRGGREGWELQVTGQSTAIIRARDWSGEIVWEVEIRDAAAGRTVQTRP